MASSPAPDAAGPHSRVPSTLGAGPSAGSVRGPEPCPPFSVGRSQVTSGGFMREFLDHAAESGDFQFALGDVFTFPRLAVQHGKIESVVRDTPHPDDDRLPRVLVTVRMSNASGGHAAGADGQESLLVSGVSTGARNDRNAAPRNVANDDGALVEPEWVSVCASSISSGENGESLRSFQIHLTSDGCFDLPSGTAWVDFDEWHDTAIVTECPTLDALVSRYQNQVDEVEGVVFSDDAVDSDLHARLTKAFDGLAALQKTPDYHPHTNGVVLDVVHPSLYPYIHGVSQIRDGFVNLRDAMNARWSRKRKRNDADGASASGHEESVQESEAGEKDRWGRKFEDSQFQWLPSIFSVSAEGKCSIKTYINNMPSAGNETYRCLEQLFELFLPLMQSCYGYLSATRLFDGDNEDLIDVMCKYEPDFTAASMLGRDVRVVSKMVEYQLTEGKKFDGVWHVEGMSHERIVMTCLYILDRDEEFVGGDLLFKRAWLDCEASRIFRGVPQDRHPKTEEFIDNGLRPLGRLRTPKGRLICFPNSHVHKLSEMLRIDSCSKGIVRRRIIVFWIVDPEVKDNEMPTTREVAEQQGTISRADAEEYRLKLMEERKRNKQDFNVRTIELCEH